MRGQRRSRPGDDAPGGVLPAVHDHARRHAGEWFPELSGRDVRMRLLGGSTRPRCVLYRLRLGGDAVGRDVVVKVRHAVPALRKLDRGEGRRPVLTPERSLPGIEAARREYEGLELLQTVFAGRQASRYGVLRPLAWLPEHGAIVMDHVAEPTLHRVLVSQSRVPRRRLLPVTSAAAWSNSGGWLRAFHDALPGPGLPTSPSSAALADLDASYRQVLGRDRAERALLAELHVVGGRVAAEALDAPWPLATGHGDYTMRNVFASSSGRVTVFDPLPLWRVPVHEDLARFVVGMRMVGLQPLTRGAAYSRAHLDRNETAFLEGYFGRGEVPRRAVLGWQVLLLLDRWAATVGKADRRGGVHAGLRSARVALARGAYRDEARRLLSLLA